MMDDAAAIVIEPKKSLTKAEVAYRICIKLISIFIARLDEAEQIRIKGVVEGLDAKGRTEFVSQVVDATGQLYKQTYQNKPLIKIICGSVQELIPFIYLAASQFKTQRLEKQEGAGVTKLTQEQADLVESIQPVQILNTMKPEDWVRVQRYLGKWIECYEFDWLDKSEA